MKSLLYNTLSSLRKNKALKNINYAGPPNVYVAGYPISGNSWISYLISFILNCNYSDIDEVEESIERKEINNNLRGKLKHEGTRKFVNVLKTHERIPKLKVKKNDVIVYVVRDIKDVANSYFHRFERKYTLGNSNIPFLKRLTYSSIQFFFPLKIRYRVITRFLAYEWIKHVNDISDKNIIIVKYEDMIDSPLITLNKLINQIDNLAWDQEIAKAAIDKFSFNNMKKIAKKNLGEKNTTDRVGNYGDWKNYFTNEDILYFDKLMPSINQKILKLYI